MNQVSNKTFSLNQIKFFLLFVFAALGGVLYGYDLGVISGALLFIKRDIAMSINQEALLVSILFGGGSLAILISGFLSDLFGRRLIIILSSMIFVISILIINFAQTFSCLLVGRLIQGIGVGFITVVVPLYLTESMPAKLRGRGVTIFQLLLTFGILFSSMVGLYFAHHGGNWRGMFLVALIPGVTMVLGSFFLSESPRWLAMRGRYDAALEVLRRTRSEIDAVAEIKHMQHNLHNQKNQLNISETKLWQRRFIFPICLVFAIAILNQLTGMNAILQLNSVILSHAGLHSSTDAMLGTIAITGLNFVVTIIAMFLIDKVERKSLMSFGTGGIVLALLYCGAVFHFAAPDSATSAKMLLGGVLAFIFFYAIGPGALVWTVMSELLPSKVRSSGLAIALFLNAVTSSVFSGLFLKLTSSSLGYAGIFWLSGGFVFIYFLISFFLIPQTKGKSLEDIEEEFV